MPLWPDGSTSRDDQVQPKKSLPRAKVDDQTMKPAQAIQIPTAIPANRNHEGYTDGTSRSLSDPLIDQFERDTTAIPVSLRSWAAQHPYTTLAAIGSVGTLAILSSAFVTARLARRFGPSTLPLSVTRSQIDVASFKRSVADLDTRMANHIDAAGATRTKEIQDMRKETALAFNDLADAAARLSGQVTRTVESGMIDIRNDNRELRTTVESLIAERAGSSELHVPTNTICTHDPRRGRDCEDSPGSQGWFRHDGEED